MTGTIHRTRALESGETLNFDEGYTCGPDRCWIEFWEMLNGNRSAASLTNTSGGSFGRFPSMHVRPGQCQDYSEHQRIGGDIQIKVGQAVHQNRRNTPDATQGNGFVETFFRFLVLTGGSGEHPEDRTKHQNSPRQAEFASDLQVIAVRVVDEEVEENGLNGRINCRKGAQPGSEKRMMANQPERIAPNRNAILTVEIVFLSESLETAHHQITTDPHDQPEDTEKKQCGDCRLCVRPHGRSSIERQNGNE